MEKSQSKSTFQHVKTIFIAGLPVFWGGLLFIFLNVTSPLQSGPLSVLIAFALFYFFVVTLLYAVMVGIFKVGQLFGWKKFYPGRQLYYVVSVIGLGPVFLIALNTLGQLEFKEVVLVALLIAVGCFYVVRRNQKGGE
ncbi:MAG TPA: hypothetical protein VFO38_05305 [Candidatus Saccharimonadales bacterium]|nr:hypothetical protein [Candidatus Saccharimonadales bacterium]